MIREELSRLTTWSQHHRTLVARISIAFGATVVVDVVGAVLTWSAERGAKGTEIHTFGDALFFSTVQLLTVSSQIRNPLTAFGRVVDIFLEAWAIFVLTAIAGSFASFFQTSDRAD